MVKGNVGESIWAVLMPIGIAALSAVLTWDVVSTSSGVGGVLGGPLFSVLLVALVLLISFSARTSLVRGRTGRYEQSS